MTSSRFFQVAFWSMLIGVCLMVAVAISKPETARQRLLAERGLHSPAPVSPLIAARLSPVESTPRAMQNSVVSRPALPQGESYRGAELLQELVSDATDNHRDFNELEDPANDKTWSDVGLQPRDTQAGQGNFSPRQYASRPLDVIPSSVHRLRNNVPELGEAPATRQPIDGLSELRMTDTGISAPLVDARVQMRSVEPMLTRQQGPTLEEQLVAKIAELQQRLNEMELAERQKRMELLERATRLLERWEKVGQVTVPEPSILDVDPQPVQSPSIEVESPAGAGLPLPEEAGESKGPLFVPPTILDESEKTPAATATSANNREGNRAPRPFPPPHLAMRKLEPVESGAKSALLRETQAAIADIERVIHTRAVAMQTIVLDVQLFKVPLDFSLQRGITGQLLAAHPPASDGRAGQIVRPVAYGKVDLYTGDSMALYSTARQYAPTQSVTQQKLNLTVDQWSDLLTTQQAHFFSCCHNSGQGMLDRDAALGQSSHLIVKPVLQKNGSQVLLTIATSRPTANGVDDKRVLTEAIVSSGITLLLGNVFTNQPADTDRRHTRPAKVIRSEWILAVTPRLVSTNQ